MPKSSHSRERGLLVRGSLITMRRKCGKPACRCAHGELHATPALSYSVAGVTKMLMLRPHDVAEVEAAVARYHRAQDALNVQALRGIAALRARIAREKASGRGQQR